MAGLRVRVEEIRGVGIIVSGCVWEGRGTDAAAAVLVRFLIAYVLGRDNTRRDGRDCWYYPWRIYGTLWFQ